MLSPLPACHKWASSDLFQCKRTAHRPRRAYPLRPLRSGTDVFPAPHNAAIDNADGSLRCQVHFSPACGRVDDSIKSFVGTSANAVKTQIWCAVCTYVLVAIIKKRLAVEASLHSILQVSQRVCCKTHAWGINWNLTPITQLPLYDMCKAVDRGMVMGGVRLVEKTGGKSGRFVAGADAGSAR